MSLSKRLFVLFLAMATALLWAPPTAVAFCTMSAGAGHMPLRFGHCAGDESDDCCATEATFVAPAAEQALPPCCRAEAEAQRRAREAASPTTHDCGCCIDIPFGTDVPVDLPVTVTVDAPLSGPSTVVAVLPLPVVRIAPLRAARHHAHPPPEQHLPLLI